MKALTIIISILLNFNYGYAQEWKSLKAYKKETGNSVLKEGQWLKKDRKKETLNWHKANLFHLANDTGFKNYTTICQIHDFYNWFDLEREKQGHEIEWIGIAAIATHQLSYIDNGMVRFLLIRNKELVKFANQGTKQCKKSYLFIRRINST